MVIDPIPQIHRRPIVDNDSDDELNFGIDPINPGMGRFERNQNFNYNRNDDEKRGRGIDPARPNFNHIPKIQNERRPITGFMTLHIRRPTSVNLRIHVVDKEVEDSVNQTIEDTTNTN